MPYKFTSPQRRSVPDRMFINPSGKIWFIEFKKQGGRLTEGQKREIKRLTNYNVDVYVIYNVEDGKKIMAESGLAIIPADNLADAAVKIVAAVKGA